MNVLSFYRITFGERKSPIEPAIGGNFELTDVSSRDLWSLHAELVILIVHLSCHTTDARSRVACIMLYLWCGLPKSAITVACILNPCAIRLLSPTRVVLASSRLSI